MARARLLSLFSIALVCTSACAMPFVRPGNSINADWDGLPRLSEAQRPFAFFGRNNRELAAYVKDIDILLNRLARCIDAYVEGAPSSEIPRIVIFFHGGLNGLSNGLARTREFNSRRTSQVVHAPDSPPTENEKECRGDEARELQQERQVWADVKPERTIPIGDDTFRRLSSSHWIFLNWDSGFGSSFAEDACCIRLGGRYWTFWLDIPVLLLSKALDTLGQIPYTLTAFRLNALDRNFDTSKHQSQSICPLEFEGPDTETHPFDVALLGPQFLGAQGMKFIGMGGWDSMKRRAELVMDPGYDVGLRLLYSGHGDDHTSGHKRLGGAGYHLLETIAKNTKPSGDGRSPNPVWKLPDGREREVELVLIAHSMGTIVANHALSSFPQLFFSRIIYLGAAASIRSVEQDVYPYLRLNPKSGFWSFMLHPADEARDRLGFGSALRWVDIYLERVGTPRGVTFGSGINVRRRVALPGAIRKQISIVEVNGPDRPRNHQSLGDWPFVDKALGRALERMSCWEELNSAAD